MGAIMGSISRISGLMGSPPGVVDVGLTALNLCASSPAVVLACSRDLEFDGAQAGERSRDVGPRLDKDGSGAGPGRHTLACPQAAVGMGSVVGHPHQEPHGIDSRILSGSVEAHRPIDRQLYGLCDRIDSRPVF